MQAGVGLLKKQRTKSNEIWNTSKSLWTNPELETEKDIRTRTCSAKQREMKTNGEVKK